MFTEEETERQKSSLINQQQWENNNIDQKDHNCQVYSATGWWRLISAMRWLLVVIREPWNYRVRRWRSTSIVVRVWRVIWEYRGRWRVIARLSRRWKGGFWWKTTTSTTAKRRWITWIWTLLIHPRNNLIEGYVEKEDSGKNLVWFRGHFVVKDGENDSVVWSR